MTARSPTRSRTKCWRPIGRHRFQAVFRLTRAGIRAEGIGDGESPGDEALAGRIEPRVLLHALETVRSTEANSSPKTPRPLETANSPLHNAQRRRLTATGASRRSKRTGATLSRVATLGRSLLRFHFAGNRDSADQGAARFPFLQRNLTALGESPDLRTTDEMQVDDDEEEPKQDHLGCWYYP